MPESARDTLIEALVEARLDRQTAPIPIQELQGALQAGGISCSIFQVEAVIRRRHLAKLIRGGWVGPHFRRKATRGPARLKVAQSASGLAPASVSPCSYRNQRDSTNAWLYEEMN